MASHFGAEVCEWNTPIPTIWHEHVHNLNTGTVVLNAIICEKTHPDVHSNLHNIANLLYVKHVVDGL